MEFQIFIKPVGSACNLRCDYCYYSDGFKNVTPAAVKVMKRELVERYIIQHLEAERGDVAMFSWHGGEPLLAGIDFFRDVLEIQARYNRQGRQVINGIQTNGTLLNREWGHFLAENNFIAGLSIDGPGWMHDHYRISRDGKPTYARVMEGWDILRSYNVKHELLCVVNNINVDYPQDVYKFFRERGAAFLTFLPLVERNGNSGVSKKSVDPVKFGRFMVEIFDLWKKEDIGRIKIQLFEEALRPAFGQQHTLCIFREECGGVPVIEMNGDFYTCDHYVNSSNLVGNILNSTVSELLLSSVQSGFGRYKATSLPQYCRQCEVLDMCNGECPRNRFISTPGGEPGLNWLCPGYKIIFNHIRPFAEKVAGAWKSRSG